MILGDQYGGIPGIGAAVETYESAFAWGRNPLGVITGGYIASTTVDSGNTPNWEIRMGLVLGQRIADGQWTNYSPTASDGSEVATGVLMQSLRMQDLFGAAQSRFYGILVGGPVQVAKLLGFDGMARQQMEKFHFDDLFGIPGNHWFPFKRLISKTANYSILSTDNNTEFDNSGAVAPVTFTLPPIANGYTFGFRVIADQNFTISSNEGSNIIALNNAAASNLAFSTGSQRIGGGFLLFSNPGATKWIAINESAGTNAITVS